MTNSMTANNSMTPRTDEARDRYNSELLSLAEVFDFARQLEIELSEAKEQLADTKKKLKDPIAVWLNMAHGLIARPSQLTDKALAESEIDSLKSQLLAKDAVIERLTERLLAIAAYHKDTSMAENINKLLECVNPSTALLEHDAEVVKVALEALKHYAGYRSIEWRLDDNGELAQQALAHYSHLLKSEGGEK